jgi:hypothetical protein
MANLQVDMTHDIQLEIDCFEWVLGKIEVNKLLLSPPSIVHSSYISLKDIHNITDRK